MLNEKCMNCTGTKVLHEESSCRKPVEGEESPKVTISVTFEGKTNELTGDYALILMLTDNVDPECDMPGATAMEATAESVGKIGIHMLPAVQETFEQSMRKTVRTLDADRISDMLERLGGKGRR